MLILKVYDVRLSFFVKQKCSPVNKTVIKLEIKSFYGYTVYSKLFGIELLL